MDRAKYFMKKNVEKLALEFNIYSFKKFKKFSSRILPNKLKYPLIHDAFMATASLYFDSFFKPSSGFYPLIEPSLAQQRKLKKFVLINITFNFFSHLFAYIFKRFLLFLNKISLLNLRYDFCEIAPNKLNSSDLFLIINFFGKKLKFKFKSTSFLQNIIKSLVTSNISPLTILLLRYLMILPTININFIQKLYKVNPFFLRILEKSLENDLKLTKSFLSFLKVKQFVHSGWFSLKGSLLFKALSDLKIKSDVYAHGHLSQASLAFFYPIESTTLIVASEEESILLKRFNEHFYSQNKTIKFKLISKRNLYLKRDFSKGIKIIVGFSSPEIFFDSKIRKKYNYLIKSLLKLNFEVFYRPHHQASKLERKILSLNNILPIYLNPLNLLDNNKTIIIGSSTTLLLDAKLAGIRSYEISDFLGHSSAMIKSVPCYSVERFLLEINKNL